MKRGLGRPDYENRVLSENSIPTNLKFKHLPLWKSAIKETIRYLGQRGGNQEINEEA
jgi:hypothetical protein